jgi:hypothetical protein
MLIDGRCHCGNIAFALTWRPEPASIPARACSCSFCTRHGGVWTACPAGSLQVAIADGARVSRYAFETRTADFLVCTICGVAPVATSRIGERLYAVVNVNTFEGVAPALLARAPAHFGDESESERLARRQRNWIGDVRFIDAPA